MNEYFVYRATKIAHEDLVNLATKLAHEILVNLERDLVDDSVTSIGVVNAMDNPPINIAKLNFDEELLANDEWLHVMSQKHHIGMMLFSDIISLESENQVEGSLFAVAHIRQRRKPKKKKQR